MSDCAFRMQATLTVGVTALAGAIALPASATTLVSDGVNVVANSTLAGKTVTDLHTGSWAAVPATLVEQANALALAGSDHVSTTGLTTAFWTSADSGSVQFTRYVWDFLVGDTANAPVASDLTQGRGGGDWTYAFTATQNGQFSMAYNVAPVAGGNPFGLWGRSIDWSSGGGLPVSNALNPTASGVFTRSLVSGQTYTIGLNDNPNIGFNGAPGAYSGYMDGVFNWSITGVPEPGAWTLMITGFGLAGAALRRRRALAAA